MSWLKTTTTILLYLTLGCVRNSPVPRGIHGVTQLAMGKAVGAEPASLSCLDFNRDNWKAGPTWDCQPQHVHVASPAWWYHVELLIWWVGSKIKCLGEKGCMDLYDVSLEASHSQIHPDSRGRNTDPLTSQWKEFQST